jgi:hypothetical protein
MDDDAVTELDIGPDDRKWADFDTGAKFRAWIDQSGRMNL